MKKLGLIFIFVACLLFGTGMVAMAQTGLSFDLGYQELSNDLSIHAPSLGGINTDLDSPCNMYTAGVGYDFNDNLSVKGTYSWGTTDISGIGVKPCRCMSFNADDQDNTIWTIEGQYKFPVAKKLKIAAIVGYADYKTTTTGTLGSNWNPQQYSMDIKQNFNGYYLGAAVIYNPTSQSELGLSFRQMINPSGSVELCANGDKVCKEDMQDLKNSVIDVYAQTHLSKNWSATAGYTVISTDYSISGSDVSCDTKGLYLKFKYQF